MFVGDLINIVELYFLIENIRVYSNPNHKPDIGVN